MNPFLGDKQKIIMNVRMSPMNIIALITLSFSTLWFAFSRLNPLDFNPVNGDFQTFNAASRYFEGQVPYLDFANYLGMGPLLLTTLGNIFIGTDFASSVVWTNLIVSFAFIYMTALLLRLLNVKHYFAIAVAIFIIGKMTSYVMPKSENEILQIISLIFSPITLASIKSMVNTGHSLYSLRALLPFLVAPLLMLYYRSGDRRLLFVTAFVLGCGVIWSNDFGPVTAVVFGLFLMFHDKTIKGILGVISFGVAGTASAVLVATQGNPIAWLNFNLGVASDQYWYFLFHSFKYISPIDTPDDPTSYFIILGVLVTVMLWIELRKTNTNNLKVLLALQTTSIVVGIFSIINNAYAFYYLSASTYISLIIAVAYCINAKWMVPYRGIARKITVVFLAISGLFFVGAAISCPAPQKMGPHELKLGAKLHQSFDGFNEMVDKVIAHGGKPWSTYATATEAALGMHHPSHSDYIIHVLGDTQKMDYLAKFAKENPSVVITPKEDKVYWEHWSMRVNWWFYRELLSQYKNEENGPFWRLWTKKAHSDEATVSCQSEVIDRGSIKITLQSSSGGRGIAETLVTYKAQSPWYARTLVNVIDPSYEKAIGKVLSIAGANTNRAGGIGYGIPPQAQQQPIPVFLDEKGYGSIVVRSYPEGKGELFASPCLSSRYIAKVAH
jgi:hypothetical protein